MSDRYAVISSDCHGGAQLLEYRQYLPSSLHSEFDVWARDYAIPFEDLSCEGDCLLASTFLSSLVRLVPEKILPRSGERSHELCGHEKLYRLCRLRRDSHFYILLGPVAQPLHPDVYSSA